jgi:hypothetical protein
MKLDLVINNHPFELGTRVESHTLKSAAFQRAGLIRRLFNRTPGGSTRFDAKNCTLACFGEEFSLYPCTHRYLNKDRQWRTSASLFSQEDKLHRILFQVMEGQYAATSFLGRFQDACRKTFGEPTNSNKWETSWVNGKTRIVCTLHPDKVNADFLIELDSE